MDKLINPFLNKKIVCKFSNHIFKDIFETYNYKYGPNYTLQSIYNVIIKNKKDCIKQLIQYFLQCMYSITNSIDIDDNQYYNVVLITEEYKGDINNYTLTMFRDWVEESLTDPYDNDEQEDILVELYSNDFTQLDYFYIMNGKDDYRQTLLHYLAKQQFTKKVELHIDKLISYHINLNARDYDCYTSLHIAAEQNNLPFVKYLLHKGADGDVQGRYDTTFMNIAKVNNHNDIIKYFTVPASD